MSRYEAKVVRKCAAAPQQVYRVLADVPGWPTWIRPVSGAAFERVGDAEPQGAGAIRRISVLGIPLAREEILEARPPCYQQYAITSGLPVKSYVGTIQIDHEGDEGSIITWGFTLEPRIAGTGPLLRMAMARAAAFLASSLVAAAERSEAPDREIG
jgi:hypothetical protein